MDDARSILLLLCSEYLCDASILGISEAAVNRARYTSQHTGHFRRWTHVHVYTGLATPLLQQFLWTVDVGQEFVIPRPSHSCSFSWRDTGSRISTIFLAKDNCRENGIPSCKKSRVMSYIISSRATCTNARSLSPLLRRNARFRRMPSRTRTGKEIVLLAPTQPTRCLLLAFFISSYGTFISLEISHLRANMPINTIRFVSEMGIKLMIHTWTFVSFKLNSSSITNCPLSTLTNFISEGKQIVCSNNTFSSEVKVTSGVA